MVKVTIVVAIYNVADYLAKCIQSVIDQTYRNIEIILVNDGSSDNCLSICRKFETIDDRIKVINQPNQGVSTARNNGIEASAGDYIMFVDGDDCLKKDIVHTLVDNVRNNDITICSYTAFNDEDTLSINCHFFKGDKAFNNDKTDLFLQLINLSYGQEGKPYTAVGVPWGKLYKKSFLEKHCLRFNKKLIRMQDNIFNMKAFALAQEIRYIDKPLYMYRVNNIIQYKKIPYRPEYLINVLYEREKIIKEFNLDKDKRIIEFFSEEVLLSALKIIIYNARTKKYSEFKKASSFYLKDDIFERYKGCQNFISKRSVIISIYMKLGLNIFTYSIAKHVKF